MLHLPQKIVCVVETLGKQATGRTNHNLMEAGEAARQAENPCLAEAYVEIHLVLYL